MNTHRGDRHSWIFSPYRLNDVFPTSMVTRNHVRGNIPCIRTCCRIRIKKFLQRFKHGYDVHLQSATNRFVMKAILSWWLKNRLLTSHRPHPEARFHHHLPIHIQFDDLRWSPDHKLSVESTSNRLRLSRTLSVNPGVARDPLTLSRSLLRPFGSQIRHDRQVRPLSAWIMMMTTTHATSSSG